MGNVQSQRVSYMPAHAFRVRVDGEDYGKFAEASGFDDVEISVLQLDDGESNVVGAQSAGKIKHEPLQLVQGASLENRMREWRDSIVAQSGEGGDVDPTYKKIVTVEQLDRDGSTVLYRWTLYEAFISKFSGGKFDAKSSEFRMESVTITYRYSSSAAA